MGQSFFIWNGKDCRSMGIILRGPAAIVRAEERVKHVEIPGRSGDLTETEGDDVYNSYIQTVSISVRNSYQVRDVFKWLRGAGYVTFSAEPDRRQPARIIGAVTLNRVSRNIDHWAGEVQFYCQPFKELLKSENSSVSPNGTIRNRGDVAEKPAIVLTPTATSVTVAAGGNTLTITGLTIGTEIRIDCDTEMILTTSNQTDLTAKSTGAFPILLTGNNTVTGSGWTTATVERRERFL